MKIVLKYSILIIVGLILLFSIYKFIKSREKFRYQFISSNLDPFASSSSPTSSSTSSSSTSSTPQKLWLEYFIKSNNPGIEKIKDRLQIRNQVLYILPEPENYFTLNNQQTGLCVTGEADPNWGNNVMLKYRSMSCGSNSNSKFKMGSDGIIKTPSNLCFAAYYNGNSNGQPLNLSSQYCDQPFDFLPNGALKHRSSGRCVHPDAPGIANDGVGLVVWDDCNAGSRIGLNKFILPKSDHYIGYADNDHIGQLRMSDGKWIPIQDAFSLIVGPDGSEQFRYDFLGIGGAITSAANTVAGGIVSAANTVANEAKDIANKVASGTMTAADWVKNRAEDAASFATNAANSVGSWAKGATSDTLNWAKGAGNLVVKDLVNIGNSIGNFARDAANTIAKTAVDTVNKIKDFFVDLPGQAKAAFEQAFNTIKNQTGKVWDKIQPVIGGFMNIILEGSACEYMISRKLSKLEAVKAIEPSIIPKLRVIFLDLIKEAILAIPIFGLFIDLLIPIIESITPIDSKIDDLLTTIVEQDFAVVAITAVADNTVGQLVSKYCSSFEEPNIDDINFGTPKDIVVSDSDKNLFDDL